MSMLELFCQFLNNRFDKIATLPRDSIFNYCEAQMRGASEILAFYSRFLDFNGKLILELGCGWGALTNYFALNSGCKGIVALDTDKERLDFAKKYSDQKEVTKIEYLYLNSRRLPFQDNAFDFVISQNTFEHIPIDDLPVILSECNRVLNKEGLLCARFNPLYYSRHGSHLYDYIRIPWGHLLFPKKTLINVIQKLDEVGIVATKNYAVAQFLGLNKLTFHKFQRLIKVYDFIPVFIECEKENFFACLPFIGNLFKTGIKGVFKKRIVKK